MKLKAQLIKMDACSEAVEWVGRKSLKTAWAKCECADWMLWLAGCLKVDRKRTALATCDCVETVLKFVPEGEDRPARFIRVVRDCIEGKATIQDVTMARRDAMRAADEFSLREAGSAGGADVATALRAAAYGAVRAAAIGGRQAHKHNAALVRKRIPFAVIEKALKDAML